MMCYVVYVNGRCIDSVAALAKVLGVNDYALVWKTGYMRRSTGWHSAHCLCPINIAGTAFRFDYWWDYLAGSDQFILTKVDDFGKAEQPWGESAPFRPEDTSNFVDGVN